MAEDDAKSVERITPKSKVIQLARAKSAMDSRVGEERAAYGAKVTQAVDKDHLDKLAFDFVARLHKMDAGKAAKHFRNVLIYAEHLDVGAQADLEDMIEDQEDNPVEEALNGFDQGGAPKTPSTMTGKQADSAVREFRKTLGIASDQVAVQTELQRAVNKYPEIAERLEAAAENRVAEIAAQPKGSKPKGKGKKTPERTFGLH